MKFNVKELNENQLQLLGLTKKDILAMSHRTYSALMSGNRTSLIRFTNLNIPGLEGGSLDAKLSLERKPDNTVSIRFHPINQIAKNTFNLSPEEINKLNSGEEAFIPKAGTDGKELLVGLDKQTKEYIAVNKATIEVPRKINGKELTEDQIRDFKDGKEIEIDGKKFRLDPSNELGVTSPTGDILSNIEFKHSKYNSMDLMVDLALLTTGAGSFFMIGHLADLLYYSSAASIKGKGDHDISKLINENKTLRDALAKATPEIAQKFEKSELLSPKELKQMIENHLDKHIDVNAIDNFEYKAGFPTGVNAIVTEDQEDKEEKKTYTVKM